ncbi:MAG: TonB-dependent receptor, partial [Bacteroidales bacterium]|nr:TonB-dependent receptor [Bacteroidales bacterium]
FLDVELKYDINSKVQLFSKFKNLFDTKEYSNTRFSSAHIISQKVQLRGRELLIGVSLKM